MKLDTMCRGDNNIAIEMLASEFPMVLAITMKHCWGHFFIGTPCSAALWPSIKSSSRMRVVNYNWSATKQRLHPQTVAEISHHSVLSEDRIQQRETSSGSRHKDTDQCL